MIKEVSVGGIMFLEENNKRFYLLLKYERLNDAKGNHQYFDFPKGHIEKSEAEEDTLKREINEETGISKIEILNGFKERINFFFKKNNKLIKKEVIYYLVKTKIKDVKISSEHIDFKWMQYNEALNIIAFKNSKDLLKKAENFLNNSLIKYNNI